MNVLVIGSEGNIGRHLVAHLRSLGHTVTCADIRPGWREGYTMADINAPLDLLPAFDRPLDVVFLLASVVSRVTCEASPSMAVETNLAGLNNVVTLTKRASARLVYTSTSEVYGPTASPMSESDAPRPNNRYGLTKYLGEQLVEYEVREHGLDAVILRPFMVYAEDEDGGDHRSAMVRFADRLASGQEVEVHVNTSRSWLHVNDAVRAFAAAMTVPSYTIVNVGHPDVILTETLAKAVCDLLGADRRLIRLKRQPERMTAIKVPDLRRQDELLGVVPLVDIEDGIRRVVGRFKR